MHREQKQANSLLEEQRKLKLIKLKLKQERQSISEQDVKLQQLQSKLHIDLMNKKPQNTQPMKYVKYILNKRQSQMKSQNSLLEKQQPILHFQEFDHIPLLKPKIEKIPSSYIRCRAKSFHDESFNVINYKIRQKVLSKHEEESQQNAIDQYLMKKLENIAQIEDFDNDEPPRPRNSLSKLLPITAATSEIKKVRKIKFNYDLSNSKLIQEFNVDTSKNYEIARKAQDRITLYQKMLKEPLRSTSCQIYK